MAGLIAPVFTQRVPFQFLSDDEPSLSITGANILQNNPAGLKIVTGTSAKVQQDINLMPHLRGVIEAPPFSIQVQWKTLAYSDYLKLAALQPYYLTMITMRNLGYYGRLVLDGPDSVSSSGDIVSANGMFYVISPSDDGGATGVHRIPDPTTGNPINFSKTLGAAGSGFISSGVGTLYYFLTLSSSYGETNYCSLSAAPNNNGSVILNWNWPTTTSYCQYATIYCSTDASGNNSRLLAQVPSALSSQWNDYVGYQGLTVDQSLPSSSSAYRGRWQYGIWWNES